MAELSAHADADIAVFDAYIAAIEAVLYAVDVNLRGLDDAGRRQVYADSRDRLR